MPISPAARTVRSNAAIPARCPNRRGRPRFLAQRPLPSMIRATCFGKFAQLSMLYPLRLS